MDYTGHEVKSFKEYNIPLRNDDLYRTRGIPAKDNASRHAKGERPLLLVPKEGAGLWRQTAQGAGDRH